MVDVNAIFRGNRVLVGGLKAALGPAFGAALRYRDGDQQ